MTVHGIWTIMAAMAALPQISVEDYLREFYRNVDDRQALDVRRRFYLQLDDESVRGMDISKHLLTKVNYALNGSATLISGPRGSGKSSELFRFGRMVQESGRQFLYADAEDYLKPWEPLEAGTFLPAVAAGMIQAVQRVVPHSQVGKALQSDYFAMFKRFRLSVPEIQINVPFIAATLRSWFTEDESARKALREVMQSQRKVFRDSLHEIIQKASQELVMESQGLPVFVFDSVDHWRGTRNNYDAVRDSVEYLFQEMSEELKLPGFHVVYSVPTYVKCDFVRLPMLNVKVMQEDGTDYSPGIDQLRKVLDKRAPDDDSSQFFGEYQTRIIRGSGGLFRDLLLLSSESILVAKTNMPVTEQMIIRAESIVREQMTGGASGLTKEQYVILSEIQKNRYFRPERTQLSDFDYLESRGAILSYPNGDPWLGVHPLLQPRLES